MGMRFASESEVYLFNGLSHSTVQFGIRYYWLRLRFVIFSPDVNTNSSRNQSHNQYNDGCYDGGDARFDAVVVVCIADLIVTVDTSGARHHFILLRTFFVIRLG